MSGIRKITAILLCAAVLLAPVFSVGAGEMEDLPYYGVLAANVPELQEGQALHALSAVVSIFQNPAEALGSKCFASIYKYKQSSFLYKI